MKKAIYPGSFDPVTYGHIDIIRRAACKVDELIVCVMVNSSKTPMFSVEERVGMLEEVTKDIPNVKVRFYRGLQVEYARSEEAFLVHGLRAVTDFEYELQITQASRAIYPEVDTIFITASLEYAYLSSSIVRETAMYEGDISKFVPPYVADKVRERVSELQETRA